MRITQGPSAAALRAYAPTRAPGGGSNGGLKLPQAETKPVGASLLAAVKAVGTKAPSATPAVEVALSATARAALEAGDVAVAAPEVGAPEAKASELPAELDAARVALPARTAVSPRLGSVLDVRIG